jgi:hypothetical protein
MSTSETDEYKIGTCPCGKGEVVKTVVTQDNPWSGADISYRLDCGECRNDWELSRSGDQLTLRSSKIPAQHSEKNKMQAQQSLATYVRDLAAKYYAAQNFKTKKAEREHLVELGISNGSYRTYLEDRKRSPMHRVGYPNRNAAFVSKLVSAFGNEQQYERLLKSVAEAEAAYKIASATIVRWNVKL